MDILVVIAIAILAYFVGREHERRSAVRREEVRQRNERNLYPQGVPVAHLMQDILRLVGRTSTSSACNAKIATILREAVEEDISGRNI